MKISKQNKVNIVFIVLMVGSFVVANEIIKVASMIIDTSKVSGDVVGMGVGAILLTVPTILMCGFIGIGHILSYMIFDNGDSDE